jgi:hypothetical protein
VRRYGPLFRTHIFGEPVLIASGTEDVKLVLQSEGKLFHPAYPVEHTGRTSAPAIHGEEWKAWRRFALSKVGFLALKDRINAVEEFALTNLSTWEGRRVLVGEEARSVRMTYLQLIFNNQSDFVFFNILSSLRFKFCSCFGIMHSSLDLHSLIQHQLAINRIIKPRWCFLDSVDHENWRED